jgi:N utilization substance protein A
MTNTPVSRTARTEFASALAQVAHERGIDVELILESIKTALIAAFRKDYPQQFAADWTYEVQIDPVTGESKIFGVPPTGGKKTEVTPPGFGRIAAQTAKQVILQKIREAEKSAVLGEYEKRLGTLVNGMVLRFDGPNVIVDVGKSEATMPPQEKIPSENYHINQRLVFFLADIRETMRGREIIVSRAAKGLIEALFKREVPEVANGSVEVKSIAREPGSRTKIAVSSNTPGVDPVGSCVGQKGVRVQAVINEVAGEKIDIVQYSDDPAKYIANSLSPAQGIQAKITSTKKLIAKAIVPDDQLSLAIGREGQNVRLAGKLTGYKIDVVGTSKTTQDDTTATQQQPTDQPDQPSDTTDSKS